ncbi:glycosyltransferase family 2 protein [Foetidibacter luteolus]|uniref:glycosyltransferase family 2 protein n=1 Tax=Foetidibacter luteolus TaxID=2608880 RepID=UPI00129A9443|nr:glycosyltransferase [Foetidibacter luteolus]
MSDFQPFIMAHVNTEKQFPVTDCVRLSGQNTYLVLWWRNFPLCHYFIYEEDSYDGAALLPKLYEAMLPTLRHYADVQHIPIDETVQQIWLGQQQDKWNSFADGIFVVNGPLLFSPGQVSVVICTRNRSVYLKSCLQRLLQQQHKPLEIIVVDNAPTDNLTKEVVASFPGVQYCLESRPGLDFARNAGAKAATGSIIAYTDDDAVLDSLWTYYMAQAFNRDNVMGVTGLIFAEEITGMAQLVFESFWTFNRGYLFKDYDAAWFNAHVQEGAPAWEIGAGASMAFRREIFSKIGYFDERLDVGAAGCNGDSEYWYRILASGYTIRYTPLAVAYHQHRREMKALKRQIFYYMRGFTAALYIQHERFGHKGNLRHLYRKLLPWYLRIFPKALRSRFTYNYSTYIPELNGIVSGLFFYYRNRMPLKNKKQSS